jgi:NAD(P)-dependent dehydrogenase (short-subunit alcohol dehydrogenase family)
MVTQSVARYGRLDILVNNAGILSSAPYDKVTEMEWDRVMEINVKGQFFASSEALKPMLAQGWGRIIFISSLSGRSGGVAAGVAYVASKAALIGVGRHLARKVARNGITVNVVAPGTTETDMLKMYREAEIAAQKNAILMGRLGKPEEIADTVAFLASDSAAFITGAVIDVNGGMYMG